MHYVISIPPRDYSTYVDKELKGYESFLEISKREYFLDDVSEITDLIKLLYNKVRPSILSRIEELKKLCKFSLELLPEDLVCSYLDDEIKSTIRYLTLNGHNLFIVFPIEFLEWWNDVDIFLIFSTRPGGDILKITNEVLISRKWINDDDSLTHRFAEWMARYRYLDYLKSTRKFYRTEKKLPSVVTGFNACLSGEQFYVLFNELTDHQFIDCEQENFDAMFSSTPQPIGWIDFGDKRKTPNKQTIFEFFYLLYENGFIDKASLDTSRENSNNFYRKLEVLFPGIKNFSASSGSGRSQQKTPRQKLLREIISNL